uniref:Uncharacterized protein n=1 Tax=Romanomermis culicivorax TaxID=13658 RepID=A0A915IST7_ROMCU
MEKKRKRRQNWNGKEISKQKGIQIKIEANQEQRLIREEYQKKKKKNSCTKNGNECLGNIIVT